MSVPRSSKDNQPIHRGMVGAVGELRTVVENNGHITLMTHALYRWDNGRIVRLRPVVVDIVDGDPSTVRIAWDKVFELVATVTANVPLSDVEWNVARLEYLPPRRRGVVETLLQIIAYELGVNCVRAEVCIDPAL